MRRAKVALVFGTRPEIIKLSALIRLLQKRKDPYVLIHTGQHYSYEMDRLFFKELELPEPAYQLSVRSQGRHGEHAGRMAVEIERILLKERPATVFVQGDTNSVLAGSLAALKIPGMRLAHVEAGLRSYDRAMPEEINRIVSDHASDLLFVPTQNAALTLRGEGIARERIFVTGNTIVDAVKASLALARKKVDLAKFFPEKGQRFMLMTLHRQENVDDAPRLRSIFRGLELVLRKFGLPILFPAHPRTVARIRRFKVALPKGLRMAEPVGFLDFLRLEEKAELILTDSGGVQEEACILRVPCVTLRTTTERPETVKAGANAIVGYKPEAILRGATRMISRRRAWANPFGDGRASARMLRIARVD